MAQEVEVRHRPSGAGAVNTNVSVSNTSTEIAAAKADRECLVITNDSSETVYIAVGGAASTTTGHRLNSDGGTIAIGRNSSIPWTGAVNGVVNSDTSRTVLKIEF